MKCPECRAEMTALPLKAYRYTDSGQPNVMLHGVKRLECPNGHSGAVAIPRLAGLHRALAREVAAGPARLGGAEVRFLRKHLGWSGVDFARTMGVDPATVSRWENDKEPMGPIAERLLRLMAIRGVPVEDYPTERLAEVAQDDAPRHLGLELTIGASGWHADEEAA